MILSILTFILKVSMNVWYKLESLRVTAKQILDRNKVAELVPVKINLNRDIVKSDGLGRCLNGTFDNQCENPATKDYNGKNYFVCSYCEIMIDFELLLNQRR